MPLTRKQQARLNARYNEVFREVGTLLLAFAPLDYLEKEQVDVASLGAFLTVGIALVALGLIREMRGMR